jgi:hypothetical protein
MYERNLILQALMNWKLGKVGASMYGRSEGQSLHGTQQHHFALATWPAGLQALKLEIYEGSGQLIVG